MCDKGEIPYAHVYILMFYPGKATVIIGTQFGDEGKGKIVDHLSAEFDIVCRSQGGSNAGHTVVVGDQKYAFHLLPSGILRPTCRVIIGNGVVIHIPSLLKEINEIESSSGYEIKSRVFISERSHIVFGFHQLVDRLSDSSKGKNSIGTTGKGIGPCYATKVSRTGLRMIDLIYNFDNFKQRAQALFDEFKRNYAELEHDFEAEMHELKNVRDILTPMVVDTIELVNSAISNGKNVLIEGANAHLLDIDFGTYPYVTSSNTGVGGVCTGLGIPPSKIGRIFGVLKAYCTRVGHGPFPTELTDEIGEYLCTTGGEFGTTTGRKRRCGWLDLVMFRSCDLVSNMKAICLTKLDVLDQLKEIKVAVSYTKKDGKKIHLYPACLDELNDITVNYATFKGWMTSTRKIRFRNDLPPEAITFIEFIEKELNKTIMLIGVGKARDELIH